MSTFYILKDRVPVECDIYEWGRWFETAERIVDKTFVTESVMVSTVFLGVDHRFGDGPPLLFETMIFGGERDGDTWRCSTWAEAEAFHREAVDTCTKSV